MKKTMKIAGFILALTASIASAEGENWMTDFEAAKKKAAAENKDLLVDFTGSDWCGPCIQLVNEVFKYDSFKRGVTEKFILVKLDFPNDKSKMDEDTQKQNERLLKTYSVKGFPTILLMDFKGRPYVQTGYEEGGPEKYLSHLNDLQKIRIKRDSLLSAANKLKGIEKAKALRLALNTLPGNQLNHYRGIMNEVIKLDPKDESGFVRGIKLENASQSLIIKVNELMRKGKHKDSLLLIDKFVIDHQLENEEKQQLLSMKIGILLTTKDFDQTAKLVDFLITLAPNTTLAKRLTQFRADIPKLKNMSQSRK